MTALHLSAAAEAAAEAPARARSSRPRIDWTLPGWSIVAFVAVGVINAAVFAFTVGSQAERLKATETTSQQVPALERQVSQIDQRTTDMQGDLREIRRVLDRDR